MVIGSGDRKPIDILFIGDAPDRSEDLIGEPNVGSSGKLLRLAIKRAEKLARIKKNAMRFYFTSIIKCRPCDSKQEATRKPTKKEILACQPILITEVMKMNPKRIILLGKVTKDNLKRHWPEAMTLLAPEYIITKGGTTSTEYRNFVRGIVEVFRSIKRRKVSWNIK